MSRVHVLSLAVASLAMLTGCASHAPLARVVHQHTPEQKAASFDQIASLAGEWRLTDDSGRVLEGDHAATTRFDVTSAGSVVREIMFAGQPHEMTNTYHFDGEQLVVTHYCAMGNQPRMRAFEVSPGRIAFKLDNVTNLTAKDQVVMGSLVIEMPTPDTVRETWTSSQGGKAMDPTVITLRRVR